MGFSIPNEGDAAFAPQARPNSTDIDILAAGLVGVGVISGCAVTAQGTPDMTVAVAPGVVTDGTGATLPVTGSNVTITTADATNPRIDLIINGGAGNAAIAGAPAANPVMPTFDYTDGEVPLAAVYVPANDTAIASNQITDKRVLLLLAPITQATHGLAVGDVVRLSGTSYVKAQADSAANAEVVGMVAAVADANTFTLTPAGQVSGLTGLTAGTVYFLSPTTAGALTATEPTTTGQVSKPLLTAGTTTSGYLVNWRGVVVGGAGGGLSHPQVLARSLGA